jgi:hypothetical protein
LRSPLIGIAPFLWLFILVYFLIGPPNGGGLLVLILGFRMLPADDQLIRSSIPPGISGHVGEIHDHGSFLAATPAKRRLMRYSCHILRGIGNTHF